MTLELIQGLLLAFALVVILMPPYIRLLRHFRFGKQIREEGPESHMVKWGVPTMGRPTEPLCCIHSSEVMAVNPLPSVPA